MFSIVAHLSAPSAIKLFEPLAVRPALRGFAIDDSALAVAEEGSRNDVSITALAARVCPTGRDLYLEKRGKIRVASWAREIGTVVDKLLVRMFTSGVRIVEEAFEADVTGASIDLNELLPPIQTESDAFISDLLLGPPKDPAHRDKTLQDYAAIVEPGNPLLMDRTVASLRATVAYEIEILRTFLTNVRTQTDWIPLVRSQLLRLQTGVHLDSAKEIRSSRFGLNQNIKPDFVYAVGLLGDLKADERKPFYDYVAAGYAIFGEYALRVRINNALLLLVGLDLENGSLKSHEIVEVRVADDVRAGWATQRDVARDILGMSSTPNHPADRTFCPKCWYRAVCWVNGEIGKPVP